MTFKIEPRWLLSFPAQFSIVLISEPPKVPLEIFTEDQVNAALERLKSTPIYNEVLQLERLDKPPSQVQELVEQTGQKLLSDSTTQVRLVEGSLPPSFSSLSDLDTEANQLFGLANQEELSQLVWYLAQFDLVAKPVRGTGACLFASIRRCMDTPLEYTNSHLCRELVMFLANNMDFFYNMLYIHIKGNYGHLRLSKEEYEAKEKAGTLTPLEREEYN